MDSYTDFALVYDTFMDETPYSEWADFISDLIMEYGITKPKSNNTNDVFSAGSDEAGDDLEQAMLSQERDLVVELGCGTGSFAQEMAKRGYDIVGIDNSEQMLQIAIDKRDKSGYDIMYLEQDMREFELYSTAGTFLSVCDSVNYLTEPEDVVKMLSLVNNYLYPGGIIIFDFNTVYKYRDVIGNTTIAEDRDDCAFIWDNWYDSDTCINEYDLTIFVHEEDDRYRRFSETHFQRGYTLEEMIRIVEESGMDLVKTIDADTHNDPTDESERIYIIARKNSDNNVTVYKEEE
ncbi:class I SAM-dependent DNA methyltransferase [Butyrivibrio fibrisolvens]|uniref:class I SAM-dependent DNA methyltransferase n=1 Tax=Butyrivibrio fibrisolvens TaxID=831 RepID=UPI0003FFC78E|nr:class I SAM-dependent methyltransferase [Butyrivibrio fibrisolvens]